MWSKFLNEQKGFPYWSFMYYCPPFTNKYISWWSKKKNSKPCSVLGNSIYKYQLLRECLSLCCLCGWKLVQEHNLCRGNRILDFLICIIFLVSFWYSAAYRVVWLNWSSCCKSGQFCFSTPAPFFNLCATAVSQLALVCVWFCRETIPTRCQASSMKCLTMASTNDSFQSGAQSGKAEGPAASFEIPLMYSQIALLCIGDFEVCFCHAKL